MEGSRFDCVTRRLAGATSRRQMLRTAAGAGLATVLAGLGATGAAAQVDTAECIGLRQRCERRRECCGGGRRDCARISRACEKDRFRGENRCCGTEGAPCGDNSCFCCAGFVCGRDGKCGESADG